MQLQSDRKFVAVERHCNYIANTVNLCGLLRTNEPTLRRNNTHSSHLRPVQHRVLHCKLQAHQQAFWAERNLSRNAHQTYMQAMLYMVSKRPVVDYALCVFA